ncbi:diguanylate cyclase [bacterium]|nr:diguanylate cyclase [bacterium]
MNAQGPDKYLQEGAAGLHRRLHRAGTLLNLAIGSAVFGGIMIVEKKLAMPVLVTALVLALGFAPLVRLVMPRIHRRFEPELHEVLDAGPQKLSSVQFDAARRSLIMNPWLGALTATLVWLFFIPFLLFWISTLFGTTTRYSIGEIYLAVMTVVPLISLAILFSSELVLRPYVSALFPRGGVDQFHSPFVLTLRKKLLFSILLLVLYRIVVAAFLTYRRTEALQSGSTEAVSDLASLEKYLIFISLGMVILLIVYIKQGIELPVERLVNSLKAVEKGDLNQRMVVESFDAFGIMADRFNHMVEGLQEREKLSKENLELFVQLRMRAKDQEELLKLYEEASTQARTDVLTKLFNRRAFEELVVQNFFEYKQSRYPFSILMLDIDHFKSINDKYGHPSGDIVIQAVAEVIKGTSRLADVAARWGGEEFIIALPSSDLNQGYILGERIREKVEKLVLQDCNGDALPKVTVSLGASVSREDDINLEQIIERADQALYEAKKSGRNRVKTS